MDCVAVLMMYGSGFLYAMRQMNRNQYMDYNWIRLKLNQKKVIRQPLRSFIGQKGDKKGQNSINRVSIIALDPSLCPKMTPNKPQNGRFGHPSST
jgi:hypothetical protein